VRHESRISAGRWRRGLAGAAVAALLAGCGTAPNAGVRNGTERLAAESSAGTLLRVGDAARAAGDLGTAIQLYQRAAAAAPQDAVPLTRLAAALTDAQAYTEASGAYAQAATLAPGDPEIEHGTGRILLLTGKPLLALPHLEAALAKRGDDPKLYNALGLAHDLAGRHDLAQAAYRQGLARSPSNPALLNNLGLSQALAEDFPAAIDTLSALAALPAATARHRQNLALAYGLAHETAKAAAVARTDLDERAVKNNLAYYAMLRGLGPEARTAAIFGGQLRRPEGAPARE